jgi:hypothetical protein
LPPATNARSSSGECGRCFKETAEKLVDTWIRAWESASEARLGGAGQLGSPFDAPGYKNVEDLLRNLRNAFVELAKAEIGLKARSHEEAGSSTPDAAIPVREAGAQSPEKGEGPRGAALTELPG